VGRPPPSRRGEPGDAQKREEKERYEEERASGAGPHLRNWCLNVPAQPHQDIDERVGSAHHRGMEREGGGGGLSRSDAKKVGGGGGKGAAARGAPGRPRRRPRERVLGELVIIPL
jgi:hypothetical protein